MLTRAVPGAGQESRRLQAIDVVRGIVMVLMTLDHASSSLNAGRLMQDSAATFFLAVLTRSMAFIALQLLADVALAGYVYLLIQYKNRTQNQRSKVGYLGAAYREPMPYMNAQYLAAPRESSGPRLVPLRQTASN